MFLTPPKINAFSGESQYYGGRYFVSFTYLTTIRPAHININAYDVPINISISDAIL